MKSFYDIPFPYRLGLLVVLMLLVSIWEWRRRGTRATRWKEYSFIVAGGGIGAAFGVVNDRITWSISPEYFEIWKDVHGVWEVIQLGAQAGFIAGAVLSMAFLFANNPKKDLPRATYAYLVLSMAWPAVSAITGALLGGVLGHQLGGDRFHLVWGAHCGLYAGAIAGTVRGSFAIRRHRASLTPETATDG